MFGPGDDGGGGMLSRRPAQPSPDAERTAPPGVPGWGARLGSVEQGLRDAHAGLRGLRERARRAERDAADGLRNHRAAMGRLQEEAEVVQRTLRATETRMVAVERRMRAVEEAGERLGWLALRLPRPADEIHERLVAFLAEGDAPAYPHPAEAAEAPTSGVGGDFPRHPLEANPTDIELPSWEELNPEARSARGAPLLQPGIHVSAEVQQRGLAYRVRVETVNAAGEVMREASRTVTARRLRGTARITVGDANIPTDVILQVATGAGRDDPAGRAPEHVTETLGGGRIRVRDTAPMDVHPTNPWARTPASAEARAWELLVNYLDGFQVACLAVPEDYARGFLVRGGASGILHWISTGHGPQQNMWAYTTRRWEPRVLLAPPLERRGLHLLNLCALPSGPLPNPDVWLGQAISIANSEDSFRAMTNTFTQRDMGWEPPAWAVRVMERDAHGHHDAAGRVRGPRLRTVEGPCACGACREHLSPMLPAPIHDWINDHGLTTLEVTA